MIVGECFVCGKHVEATHPEAAAIAKNCDHDDRFIAWWPIAVQPDAASSQPQEKP